MNEQQKRQLCDRLLDVIEQIHGAKELIDMDDPALARVQLKDAVGQIQRMMFKLI